MESEIKLEIVGLVYNHSVMSTYGLVLGEVNGGRRFSVTIGEPEAQSIALKINNKVLARPLTHDLVKDILSVLKAGLKKVLIYDLIDDIFYSELFIEAQDGKVYVVDARTSDAAALAVRADCPIYIKKELLDIVGTIVDPAASQQPQENVYTLNNIEALTAEELKLRPEEELEDFLEEAVKDEKYELAVKLRNALNLKKNDNQ